MSKTQSTTAKLSDTQLVILGAAAQRANGALLPFAQTLSVKGAALSKIIESLSRRKLVAERRIGADEAAWRRDEDGLPLGLFITTGGLLALGVEDAEKDGPSEASASISRLRKKAVARPRRRVQKTSPASSKQQAPAQTKQDLVVQMLRRQYGVSIEDIIAKTKWQPHSVRGFFSGVVRKKLKIPARLGCRQGRRAPLPHRADRIPEGLSHGSVLGPSPAPKAARAILRQSEQEERASLAARVLGLAKCSRGVVRRQPR